MRCATRQCRRYFCYLCNEDLGRTDEEAHNSGHFFSGACWMCVTHGCAHPTCLRELTCRVRRFDDQLKGSSALTPETVRQIRLHTMISAFLSSLSEQERGWVLQDDACVKELQDAKWEAGGGDEGALGRRGAMIRRVTEQSRARDERKAQTAPAEEPQRQIAAEDIVRQRRRRRAPPRRRQAPVDGVLACLTCGVLCLPCAFMGAIAWDERRARNRQLARQAAILGHSQDAAWEPHGGDSRGETPSWLYVVSMGL